MQIERSIWARRTAATTCRTLQEEWCPACHQDEATSAAVLGACLENSEILKNTQVENAVEVKVINVERTRSDIASLTRQSAQSDSSLTTSAERAGDTRFQQI